jgi:hypothetical protein
MVNATNSDGNSSDTTNQGGTMERNYKDDGSSTRMKQTGDQRSGIYEIQEYIEIKGSTLSANQQKQVRMWLSRLTK